LCHHHRSQRAYTQNRSQHDPSQQFAGHRILRSRRKPSSLSPLPMQTRAQSRSSSQLSSSRQATQPSKRESRAEARSQKPEARSQKPEARSQKPEA
jgi:hypothetical protein